MNLCGIELPRNLQIGTHVYKLTVPYEFNRSDGTNRIGFSSSLINELQVATTDISGLKMVDTVIMSTLWHEILHAVNSVYNAEHLEEEEIDRLSQGITQVFLQLIGYKPQREGAEDMGSKKRQQKKPKKGSKKGKRDLQSEVVKKIGF